MILNMDGLSLLMQQISIPTDPQEFEIYLREKYPELRVIRGHSLGPKIRTAIIVL